MFVGPVAAAFIGLLFVTGSLGQQPVKHCKTNGAICSTCDTMSMCIDLGDGLYQKIDQPCREGEKCVAGACVKGALCNYRDFSCTDAGIFPNPYDCHKYHICVPKKGGGFYQSDQSCPIAYSYDSLLGCIKTENTTACTAAPVPECTLPLEMFAVPANPNLYGVCIAENGTLAPNVYKCPGGRKFNSKSKPSCS